MSSGLRWPRSDTDRFCLRSGELLCGVCSVSVLPSELDSVSAMSSPRLGFPGRLLYEASCVSWSRHQFCNDPRLVVVLPSRCVVFLCVRTPTGLLCLQSSGRCPLYFRPHNQLCVSCKCHLFVPTFLLATITSYYNSPPVNNNSPITISHTVHMYNNIESL